MGKDGPTMGGRIFVLMLKNSRLGRKQRMTWVKIKWEKISISSN